MTIPGLLLAGSGLGVSIATASPPPAPARGWLAAWGRGGLDSERLSCRVVHGRPIAWGALKPG